MVEWDWVIEVDLKSVFLNCKYFIFLIGIELVGKIINIFLEFLIKGRVNVVNYCVVKGVVNSLICCFVLELVFDILVNVIVLGLIEIDMFLFYKEFGYFDKEKDIFLKWLGIVVEVVVMVVLFVFDEGNFYCG